MLLIALHMSKWGLYLTLAQLLHPRERVGLRETKWVGIERVPNHKKGIKDFELISVYVNI